MQHYLLSAVPGCKCRVPPAGMRLVPGRELALTPARRVEVDEKKWLKEKPQGTGEQEWLQEKRAQLKKENEWIEERNRWVSRWAKEPRPEWVIVEGTARGRFDPREFDPFEAPSALFTEFADLDATKPDAALAFAKQYGFLSGASKFWLAGSPEPVFGEEWAHWQRNIRLMKTAYRVFTLLNAEGVPERKGLARLFRWRVTADESGWFFDTHPDHKDGTLEPPDRTRGWVNLDNEDAREDVAARVWLSARLNGQIETLVTPRVARDPEQGGYVFNLIPKTLLAAMWLQFVQAFVGQRTVARCEHCGRGFWLKTEKRRFCSDGCKAAAYRERRGSAARAKKVNTTKRKGK
jgi:hypothetical protein